MEMELGNMRNVIKMQNKDLELLRVDNEQLMKDIEVRRRTETDFQYRIANHDRFRLQMEDTAKGKDKAIESLRQ